MDDAWPEGLDSEAPDISDVPDISRHCPPLPWWLARRLQRPGEEITWVYGPRFNPSWELLVTHPIMFVLALVLGILCIWLGSRWSGPPWTAGVPIMVGLGAGIIVGSVFVLGIFSGYFTRLVVTNYQIVIFQGYERCRSWDLRDLPPSLRKYRLWPDDKWKPTVDLEALKTMLGSLSDKVSERKSILALGKHLEQIKVMRPAEDLRRKPEQ